jgi:glycosyltransferase involved in cell wall biosynthesis
MTPAEPPLVTIGVVSYNRLHYLRVLLESLRLCADYPRLEWIVVDGGSVEPGLRDYLESLGFLDRLEFAPCTHAEAMNAIVEEARGEFLLLLPEDIQFIARGRWLDDLVEIAARPGIGHVTFDAQRRVTLARRLRERRLEIGPVTLPLPRRRYRVVTAASGAQFVSWGSAVPGVISSGIMTFGRTDVWRRLGPWRTREELTFAADSSLGAEADMALRYRASGLELESCVLQVPVAADIITDPRGTKARVRGRDRRYGRYASPPVAPFYYRIRELDDLRAAFPGPVPAAFEDIVEPLGFELPVDAEGHLLKTSVDFEREPFELVGG